MADGPHLLIVAGDPSADRHGAALAGALRRQVPGLRISALGGPHLREASDRFIFPLVGVGGFGFWEPLLKIPQLWRVRQQIREVLDRDRPDALVPMDYYGFNIHVARDAKRRGIPVLYYISPQVWASRPGRIQKLKSAVDRMLVIFPFERDLYEKAGVPVRFVGHPLLGRLPAPQEPTPELRIGFLPGSRWGTIRRHLPIVQKTAQRLRSRFPAAEFLLFRPTEIPESDYRTHLSEAPWLRIVADESYQERKRLSLAISVSGTAALENMLLGIPMIIMYRLSAVTFAIAKRLVRVPYVGIPNLLAGRPVVPELLQDEASPERLAEAATDLLDDWPRRQSMRQELLALRESLQQGGTDRAAAEIASMLPALPLVGKAVS